MDGEGRRRGRGGEGEKRFRINLVDNKKAITFALPNKTGMVVKPKSSLKV